MKVLNSLTSLGVTLEELYNPQIEKQIVVSLSDKNYEFNVVLTSLMDKIDCKISSFGANLWIRTNKGINYEKYQSLSTLQSAIVKSIKNKVDTAGDIRFSIGNTRYTF
jgi:hypothetical protein